MYGKKGHLNIMVDARDDNSKKEKVFTGIKMTSKIQTYKNNMDGKVIA